MRNLFITQILGVYQHKICTFTTRLLAKKLFKKIYKVPQINATAAQELRVFSHNNFAFFKETVNFVLICLSCFKVRPSQLHNEDEQLLLM